MAAGAGRPTFLPIEPKRPIPLLVAHPGTATGALRTAQPPLLPISVPRPLADPPLAIRSGTPATASAPPATTRPPVPVDSVPLMSTTRVATVPTATSCSDPAPARPPPPPSVVDKPAALHHHRHRASVDQEWATDYGQLLQLPADDAPRTYPNPFVGTSSTTTSSSSMSSSPPLPPHTDVRPFTSRAHHSGFYPRLQVMADYEPEPRTALSWRRRRATSDGGQRRLGVGRATALSRYSISTGIALTTTSGTRPRVWR